MQAFQDSEGGKYGTNHDNVINQYIQSVVLNLSSVIRVRRREEKHGKN
jgi:hypothetical protein